MRELPALPEPRAALGMREQPAQPEPRALPEQPHWAPRLGLAALPELQALLAEPGLAVLPEFRASAAWAVRRASCRDALAVRAYRSRPQVPRRRSGRISREFPDGQDHALECCAFRSPFARG